MSTGYLISNGYISGPMGLVVAGLELLIPDHAITMLVGPSGTGKSLMLRVLSGGRLPAGFSFNGTVSLRGASLSDMNIGDVVFESQQRTGDEALRLDGIDASPCSVLLLDEPAAAGADSWLFARVGAMLGKQRSRGLGVVVTHNLELVRQCADYVCLVCAGRVDCFTDRETFLTAPPTDLCAQFVRQGNCWPKRPLPKHFHWVRPGLAGMGRPGLLGAVDDDLSALAQEGVDTLVSLTERRFPQDRLKPYGITGKHLPIVDMSVPAINAAASVCSDVSRALANGSRVAFHCEAGLGRTGTMLASYLSWTGTAPDDAIAEVRANIRGAIQTDSQVSFVRRFAEAFGGRPC